MTQAKHLSLHELPSQVAGIHPAVWASYVLENRPCSIGNQYSIPATGTMQIENGTVEAILIAADFGNDSFKLTLRSKMEHTITCVRIPATYQPAARITYGIQGETWQEQYHDNEQAKRYQVEYAHNLTELPPQYSEEFCIGDNAVRGDSLPTGPTDQRLNDPRSDHFLKASLVKALRTAGYQPGHHYLSLSFGLRNEEITGKQILPQTREAIGQLKHTFTILCRDNSSNLREWTITIGEIFPYPQTFGTFFALDTDLYGRSVLNNYLSFVLVDLGGYDSHAMEVDRQEKGVSAIGKRFVDGTVSVARTLAAELKKPEHYPLLGELTDAEAQQVLITERVLYGGQWLDVSPIVRKVKDSRGSNLLATVLSQYQKANSYFVFTGGGSILLADEIKKRMADMQRSAAMYMILDPVIAPFANCVGLYGLLSIRKRPR